MKISLFLCFRRPGRRMNADISTRPVNSRSIEAGLLRFETVIAALSGE